MTDTRLLKAQLALRGLGIKDLANVEGWSLNTAYKKVNGKVYFTVPEIQICKEYLMLDSETAHNIFFAASVS